MYINTNEFQKAQAAKILGCFNQPDIEKGGQGSGRKNNRSHVPQTIDHPEHGLMNYSHSIGTPNNRTSSEDHYYKTDKNNGKYATQAVEKYPDSHFKKQSV